MSDSELNRVKDDFEEQMDRSFKLIQNINKAKPFFPAGQIYLIYEFSFLRIFLSWESFIERTFILYMLGSKTDTGYTPKVYVSPKDQNHAYQFVKEGREYVGWTSPDVVIRRSNLFFEDGKPYKETFERIRPQLQDIKTVRNVIVHTSIESREKFETLIRREFGYVKVTTPGEFLCSKVPSKNLSYITHFSNLLKFASGKIVR